MARTFIKAVGATACVISEKALAQDAPSQGRVPPQLSLGPTLIPLIVGTLALCLLIAFVVARIVLRTRARKKRVPPGTGD